MEKPSGMNSVSTFQFLNFDIFWFMPIRYVNYVFFSNFSTYSRESAAKYSNLTPYLTKRPMKFDITFLDMILFYFSLFLKERHEFALSRYYFSQQRSQLKIVVFSNIPLFVGIVYRWAKYFGGRKNFMAWIWPCIFNTQNIMKKPSPTFMQSFLLA